MSELESQESLWLSENRIHKRSHKLEGNRVERIRTLSFLFDSFYESVAYDPVKTSSTESQTEAEELTNYKARNRVLWLVYSSSSAYDSDNRVLRHYIVSDRVISRIAVLLPTPLVWFLLAWDRNTPCVWLWLRYDAVSNEYQPLLTIKITQWAYKSFLCIKDCLKMLFIIVQNSDKHWGSRTKNLYYYSQS